MTNSVTNSVSDPTVHAYAYRAIPLAVVDGDTIDVRVDLGFKMTVDMRVRLFGVNTPERSEPDWFTAKRFVEIWVGLHPVTHAPPIPLVLHTAKPKDKYGRWLATVYATGRADSLNAALLAEGLAVAYDGGAKT